MGLGRKRGTCSTRRVRTDKMDECKRFANPPPTESPLLFEIDPEPIPETLTALGGVPLPVRTLRSLGLAPQVREHVRI